MRILLIHNKYKHAGGEDSVFRTEKNILEENHHAVKEVSFDNSSIDGWIDRLKISYRLFYNNQSEKIISEAIKTFRPDIIHVHNFFYIASPSIFFSAYKNKIPVVLTLHNYRLICSGALLMRNNIPCELCINKTLPLSGIMYGCHRSSKIQTAQLTSVTSLHKIIKTWNTKISAYIALTEFSRKIFLSSSLKLLPDQIVVKSNSVDDVLPNDTSKRESFFLFVGRLSEEKGIRVLLQAFEGKNVQLEIIGDGPMKFQVQKAVLHNSNILYSGYRDKEYIIRRLQKCKAVIVPSLWYEGLPTIILESFSTATPVIVSDIENLNEIVKDGYNGLHFKTNNEADLYRVVESFYKDSNCYYYLYNQARQTFLDKYTHQINYNNLINIYSDVIKKNRISK